MATIQDGIGKLSKTIENVTDLGTDPIEITITDHELTDGERIVVSGVGGNTAANGTHTLTVIDADTFSLDSTTANGNYTSGGTIAREYSTIQAWETATTISVGADIYEGLLYDDPDPTTGIRDGLTFLNTDSEIRIAGASSLASNSYRHLRGAPGHEYHPETNTGARVNVETVDTSGRHGIILDEAYARLSNIGIIMYSDSGNQTPASNPHYGVLVETGHAGIVVDGVYVDFSIGGTTFNACFGVPTSASNGPEFRNCIAHGSGLVDQGSQIGFYCIDSAAAFYNCAAWGFVRTSAGYGWLNNGIGPQTYKNCIAVNNRLDWNVTHGSQVFDTNISSDGSAETVAGSANSFGYIPSSTVFNNAEYGDFRPVYNGKSIDAGLDLSGTFTTDFSGATRATNSDWEIGPYDDFQVPVSATAPTINTSTIGTGGDYATIADWELNTRGHLVGLNTIEIGQLLESFDLLSAETTIYGSITDENHYRELTYAANIKYNPLTDSDDTAKIGSTADVALRISESHFRLTGIKIENFDLTTSDKVALVIDAVRGVIVNQCFVEIIDGVSSTYRRGIWLRLGKEHVIKNTIVRGETNAKGMNQGILVEAYDCRIWNTVISRCREGTSGIGLKHTATYTGNQFRNVVIHASDTCFDVATGTTEYCAADDTSVDGEGSIASISNPFNAAASRDYRLTPTADVISVGIDLSDDFQDDFDGTTRRSPGWEMGAYEGFLIDPQTYKPTSKQSLRRCSCFVVTADDATTLYLTNLNTPLTFKNQEFVPVGAFDASARHKEIGLRGNTVDFVGPVYTGVFEFDDLRRGKWDGAEVIEYVVDWKYPFNEPVNTYFWEITEIQFDSEKWMAQLGGPEVRLNREVGHIHTRNCTHDVFSNDPARGNVCLLLESAYIVTGVSIDTVNNDRLEFVVTVGASATELPTQASTYYPLGKLRWKTGNNAGLESEVKTHIEAGGNATISLQLKTHFAIQVGDTFDILPGCDGRKETCLATFNNVINHHGDIHTPGSDEMLKTPKSK